MQNFQFCFVLLKLICLLTGIVKVSYTMRMCIHHVLKCVLDTS